MRVMVFAKAMDGGEAGMEPTPEMLAAFEAMDRFTEELVEAGVFVAAAGLKAGADAKRVVTNANGRTIVDGPRADAGETIVGFSIWQVQDMAEALAWAERSPMLPGVMEIRPFYEAADLAGFASPEEIANPRTGERGRLGVA